MLHYQQKEIIGRVSLVNRNCRRFWGSLSRTVNLDHLFETVRWAWHFQFNWEFFLFYEKKISFAKYCCDNEMARTYTYTTIISRGKSQCRKIQRYATCAGAERRIRLKFSHSWRAQHVRVQRTKMKTRKVKHNNMRKVMRNFPDEKQNAQWRNFGACELLNELFDHSKEIMKSWIKMKC